MKIIISFVIGFLFVGIVAYLIGKINNPEIFLNIFLLVITSIIASFFVYQELFTDNGIKGSIKRKNNE